MYKTRWSLFSILRSIVLKQFRKCVGLPRGSSDYIVKNDCLASIKNSFSIS